MPWVLYEREQLKNDGSPEWKSFLDCATCRERVSKRTRATWHCQYVHENDWETQGFPMRPKWPERLQQEPGEEYAEYRQRLARLECPGASIDAQQVAEATRYHRWFEKGQLGLALHGKDMTELLRDAIDILSSSINEVDMERIQGDS